MGGVGREWEGSRTVVRAAVMTRILAIVLARAVCLQSVAPKHMQLQHNAIPDQVHHHRPPSTHTPPPTNVHYYPPTYTLPSPGGPLTSRKQASHSLGDSLCRSWASRALCR